MDKYGYPTKKELRTIETWPFTDCKGLLEYVRNIWHWEEYFIHSQRSSFYHLHTGGWSGNESIIGALQENQMFWFLCWVESRRADTTYSKLISIIKENKMGWYQGGKGPKTKIKMVEVLVGFDGQGVPDFEKIPVLYEIEPKKPKVRKDKDVCPFCGCVHSADD